MQGLLLNAVFGSRIIVDHFQFLFIMGVLKSTGGVENYTCRLKNTLIPHLEH